MRVCVIYDCLFPWTVGGAERWYRELAQRLAAEGHDVTYLTLRQWEAGDEPDLPGVAVVPVGRRRRPLYGPDGTRRISPPLRFGLGVCAHLLRRGREYDIVHTASFPFFSLLAAGLLRPVARYRIVCDWHEVWTAAYWRSYLGPIGGRVGAAVQWLCAQVPQTSTSFSQLHANRLRQLAPRRHVTVLTGEYGGDLTPPVATAAPNPPRVVYAGRHIAEKRVAALVPAVQWARGELPDLCATFLGDGPERPTVLAAIAEAGLEDVIDTPGFVDSDTVDAIFAGASCIAQPSSREGYGMVVVEAAARGVPVVVVRAEDNAATELVDDGVNGFVADDATAEELGAALVRAVMGGSALRQRTCDWFEANGERLSIAGSLSTIRVLYGGVSESRHPARVL